MIISGAEPFFLKSTSSHAVLLIHGFTGNPAEMLLLGQYLHSKNFTVLGIRLAGHGTNVQDLLRTTKEDWLNSALDGFSILSGCCDKISVVGASMGGLLALNLAIIQKFYKIVTLAAPIFIDDSLCLELLPPREESQGLYAKQPPRELANVPPAVNQVYRLMPFISVHELIDLIVETKKILLEVTAPILILHGKEDHTAKVDSANYIYENVSSTQKQIRLIDNMGHLLPLREGRETVFELTANFLESTNENSNF